MQPLRILALTKYGPLAASTRQRFMQYEPWLTAAGMTLEVSPLLDDDYLRERFAGHPITKSRTIRSYLQRIATLLAADQYDVLWINYELFPYLPGRFDRLVVPSGVPVVFDIDDAMFHSYDLHRSALVRRALGRKLEPLVRRSVTALCGNAYLADWARRWCTDVRVVPTVVDITTYVPGKRVPETLPVIGWIGSPSTFDYVVPHLPLLERLVADGRARVTVVGSGRAAGRYSGIDHVDWTEAGEIAAIQAMDVGIMPLPDTPWARGKCGYKLIQYMACGLPVVASPVGVNSEIVGPGVNGLLAAGPADWANAFDALLASSELRRGYGAAGRERVVRDFSLQRFGPEVAAALQAAARR